jgi:hypothetical protein
MANTTKAVKAPFEPSKDNLLFASVIVFVSVRLIPGSVIDLMLANNPLAYPLVPSAANGLRVLSYVMTWLPTTVHADHLQGPLVHGENWKGSQSQ